MFQDENSYFHTLNQPAKAMLPQMERRVTLLRDSQTVEQILNKTSDILMPTPKKKKSKKQAEMHI